MKLKIFFKIILLIVFIELSFSKFASATGSQIIAKVGNEIITSVDIENEILTILTISKAELSQDTINKTKDLAMKELIRKLIKKNEIKKYNIKDYNRNDLNKYLVRLAERLGTNKSGLKEIFKKKGISYERFVDKYITELLWNTLIFQIYKNQITVNTIEIQNELNEKLKNEKKITEYDLSEIEIRTSENNEKIIEDVYSLIKNESFEKAVKKYSISKSVINNGKIGVVSEISLSKVYLDKIKNLNVGEVSRPIINPRTIIFIKVNDKKVKNEKQDLDAEKIKNMILLKKKNEKLELFSKSHFSNLENTTLINFL